MYKSLALILATVAVAFAEPVPATQETTAPSDPQIAMIAVVADNIDIEAGKLAIEKAQDKRVKQFAELMVRDHTTVNEKAVALVKKLNIDPENSTASTNLKTEGDKTMAKLKSLSGAEFDKAYVENEVSYHESVLNVIDKTLIPNAKNAELKTLLENSRPIFASHLEHARSLKASMKE
jgi:putative membrane protein